MDPRPESLFLILLMIETPSNAHAAGIELPLNLSSLNYAPMDTEGSIGFGFDHPESTAIFMRPKSIQPFWNSPPWGTMEGSTSMRTTFSFHCSPRLQADQLPVLVVAKAHVHASSDPGAFFLNPLEELTQCSETKRKKLLARLTQHL